MNKELLETQILKAIEACLYQNDSSVINLIKLARNNDLFFPEMYELFYIAKVNHNTVNGINFSIENSHRDFGIEAPQAGEIFANSVVTSFLKLKQTLSNVNKTLDVYFLKILKSEVFFEDDFWENSIIVENFDRKRISEYKEISSSNRAHWLESKLAEKPKVKQPKI